MKQSLVLTNIKLEKFVHGGQVLARAHDGKSLFVWGGLPGELVDVRVIKKKSSYSEAIVTSVLEPSSDRVEPVEPLSYLSTSPWQIVSWRAENKAKQEILTETFTREGVLVSWQPFCEIAETLNAQVASGKAGRLAPLGVGFADRPMENPPGVFHYRNKMELGFWGDDNGLHLAHFVRGSKGKQLVSSNVSLADDSVNTGLFYIQDELRRLNVWAGDLKTVIVRASRSHETVAALFVKKQDLDLSGFRLGGLKGIDIYFSNPKSPASVPTQKLVSLGSTTLQDTISGSAVSYDVLSFFQVNLPIFEKALEVIRSEVAGQDAVDFYSGVGAIGIPVSAHLLVESDGNNIKMAKRNVGNRAIKVVHATSETALDYIAANDVLIVDPPRAGLHAKVVSRILAAKPLKVIYLSCNPSTQARDVKLLESDYRITYAQGFNFFPRTPHIESLVCLERK